MEELPQNLLHMSRIMTNNNVKHFSKTLKKNQTI